MKKSLGLLYNCTMDAPQFTNGLHPNKHIVTSNIVKMKTHLIHLNYRIEEQQYNGENWYPWDCVANRELWFINTVQPHKTVLHIASLGVPTEYILLAHYYEVKNNNLNLDNWRPVYIRKLRADHSTHFDRTLAWRVPFKL